MKKKKKFKHYRKKCNKCGRQPPLIIEHLLSSNREYCVNCLPLFPGVVKKTA